MGIDRSRFTRAIKQLEEYNADPLQLLAKAEVAYKMAIEGVVEETVSPATGEVISLTKQQPSVAVQALQFQQSVVKYIIEQVEKDEADGTGEERQLVINLSELKAK